MKMKEIDKLISAYVKDDGSRYAILINGPWGSGKTYYVRNELEPMIKEMEAGSQKKKMLPIYVSLYGITDLRAISKEIFTKTVLFGKSFNHTFKSGKTTGAKARKKYLWELAKGTLVESAKGTAANLLGALLTRGVDVEPTLPQPEEYWDYVDGTEVVLILDDLERSRIDIVELLGYVSNFVEEYSIKTILVGSEAEIRRAFDERDLAEKYLIAKDTNLDIPSKGEEGPFGGNKNGVLKTMTKESLTERVDYLFSGPSAYEVIKEKLIGFTVDFVPDLGGVFSNIAEGKLKDEQISEARSAFAWYGCSNVRTFQFALAMFGKIRPLIESTDFKNGNEVTGQVIRSVFALSITMKNKANPPKSLFHHLDFTLDDKLSAETEGLLRSEVGRFLATSLVDEERIKSILIVIDGEISKAKAKAYDPLKPLQTRWLTLSEDELKKKMADAIAATCDGVVSLDAYAGLLGYLYQYNDVFVNEKKDPDTIVERLILKIRGEKGPIVIDQYFPHPDIQLQSHEEIVELNKKVDCITAEAKAHNAGVKVAAGTATKENDWVGDLIAKAGGFQPGLYGDKKSIVGHLDVPETLQGIKNCSVSELERFLYSFLQKVYSFSNLSEYYHDDVGSVTELRDGIDKIRGESPSQNGKAIYSYVLGQVSSFLSERVIPNL